MPVLVAMEELCGAPVMASPLTSQRICYWETSNTSAMECNPSPQLATRVVNMRFGSASREEDQRRTLQRGTLCRDETEIRMTQQLKKR